MQLERAEEPTHVHALILWVCVWAIAVFTMVDDTARVVNVWLGSEPDVRIAVSPSIEHSLLVASQLS